MAYCFYNGVKLPELPSTTLANYPYCWIRKNDNTQHYDLIFTKVLGYYDATAGGIVYGANEGTAEIVHYRVAYPGNADDWTNYQTTNTWMALDVNRTVMWSNHYIPNGSPTATVMYFDAHEAIPEVAAYQIERATLVGIADQVRRVCDLETDLTPAEMEQNLRELNVDLMETFVMSGPVEQVIYPDNGCCGFSKVTVGAVSGGWGDDYGGPVEDNTWGDEYTDTDVPTGNLDYSGGTDENPSYIPEIPGEGDYKVLFKNGMKAGTAFRYNYDGESYEVKTPADCVLYAASGECMGTDENGYAYRNGYFEVILYSGSESCAYSAKKVSDLSWTNGTTTTNSYADGYFARLAFTTNIKSENWGNDLSAGFEYDISGIPYFNLGIFADEDSRMAAMYACASRGGDSETEQFVAFVSKTPIYYDGSTITNADGSPMSIYNVDAADGNEWVYTGTTDGTSFPVGGYDLTWNNHDLMDMNGENITEWESGDPIPEMTDGKAPSPVERNGTYSVDGNTMNGLVGAAQKVTGSTTPLSPTEATSALDEYYSNPAEEMKW